MSRRPDVDRKLAAWMELMPSEAPDRLVHAVIGDVRIVDQRRRRWVRAGFGAGFGGRPAVPLPVLIGLLLAVGIGGVLVGALLLQARPQPRVYLDELDTTTPMLEARAAPVIAPLVDGRAIVFAGAGIAGAELFDPTTGGHTAVAVPDLDGAPAEIYSATTLAGGEVLALAPGGSWLFDPATVAFEPLAPLRIPRDRATVVALPDGRALISGGTAIADPSSSLASAEVLDPTARTFTPAADMDWGREGHAMIALPDGRVAVFGGVTQVEGGRYPNSHAGVYDRGLATFATAADLPLIDGSLLAADLPDGRVALVTAPHRFRFDGEIAIFDPATGTFGRAVRLPRDVGAIATLDDGRVLLTGAWEDGRWTGVFDPLTQTTTDIAGTGAWSPAAARLADGRVLLAGGLAEQQPRNGAPASAPVSSMQVFR